jgi:hypothetical protein
VHEGVVAHHAQRVGRRRRPDDLVLAVEHDGRGAQHGEHTDETRVELVGFGLGKGVLLPLGDAECHGGNHADDHAEDSGGQHRYPGDDSVHASRVGRRFNRRTTPVGARTIVSPTVHVREEER